MYVDPWQQPPTDVQMRRITKIYSKRKIPDSRRANPATRGEAREVLFHLLNLKYK